MESKEVTINLEELKKTRREALEIGKKIAYISARKQSLILELLAIQQKCEHKVVVRYNDERFGHTACCLNCNKLFYGMIVGVDCYFNNIIDFQFLVKPPKNQVEFALQLFERQRVKFPKLSDAEVVELINKQIGQQAMPEQKTDFTKRIGTKV